MSTSRVNFSLGKLFNWNNIILLVASVLLVMFHTIGNQVGIFLSASALLIPLAGLMGRATEHLAERSGPGVGALINATFGNMTEILLACFALQKGLHEIVKASITGSIIGNILFVFGLSLLMGGFRYKQQSFCERISRINMVLLLISLAALILPSLSNMTVPDFSAEDQNFYSLMVSGVLVTLYFAYLFFSLVTHKDVFRGEIEQSADECHGQIWSVKKSVLWLLVATVAVAFVSEMIMHTVEHAAKAFDMSDLFIGGFVLAIIGNAAEHTTAIIVARKNKMDLTLGICMGSSAQIALFAVPILVFYSQFIGKPLDLVFNEFEIVAIGLSIFTTAYVVNDGKSDWIDGFALICLYLLIGIAFYMHP